MYGDHQCSSSTAGRPGIASSFRSSCSNVNLQERSLLSRLANDQPSLGKDHLSWRCLHHHESSVLSTPIPCHAAVVDVDIRGGSRGTVAGGLDPAL